MPTRPTPKLTSLPTCSKTLVYRLICDQIANDTIVSTVISPDRLRSWEGASNDTVELANQKAGIRITPANGPGGFVYADSQASELILEIELTIPGTCVDDLLNLWRAIEVSLYPANPAALATSPTQTFIAALNAAGAQAGVIKFAQPANLIVVETEGSKSLVATGRLSITVLSVLNP